MSRKSPWTILTATVCIALTACDEPRVRDTVVPPGTDESGTTDVLEAGAQLLQDTAPLNPFDIHLVGFHPMKEEPAYQMEAHHYCHQVNEDFAQCVLFDSSTEPSNLNGIEYIISERLFNSLPEEEKSYWHPHNYEILSGQLIAPGIPEIAENELMAGKMNSYGKTWHVWRTAPTDSLEGTGDEMPTGEPMLAWSFNRDGEARPGLVEARDARMDVDSGEVRRSRQELTPLARPQQGVDVLRDSFANTTPIAGVTDAPASAEPPAPIAPADAAEALED